MQTVADTSSLERHLQGLVEFGLALEAHFDRILFDATKSQFESTTADSGPGKAQDLLASVNEALEALELKVTKLSLRESDPRKQLTVDVQLKNIDQLQDLNARWKSKDQAA